MSGASRSSYRKPRTSGGSRSTPRHASVPRACPRPLAHPGEQQSGVKRRLDEGSRACRDRGGHPVPAGSDLGTLSPSPQRERVSRRPELRREVPHRRSRDGRSPRRRGGQPTHRCCVAHPGRSAWRPTSPRAVGRLALRDRLALGHAPRSASGARVLLCASARVAGIGDQARRLTESVVGYASRKGDLLSFLYTLLVATCPIALFVGDLETVEHHVRLGFDLAVRHALELSTLWAQCFEGVLLIERGNHRAGSQLLQSALERMPGSALQPAPTGLPEAARSVASGPAPYHHVSVFLLELAAGLGGAGQIAEGLVVVDKGLARAEQTEARWCVAELLRTKGELLVLGHEATASETAEKCFRQALDVARHQGALAWELRAAMSLARLWRGEQRASQARKLLAPVYRRFTEGFGTADLIEAKTLLASFR